MSCQQYRRLTLTLAERESRHIVGDGRRIKVKSERTQAGRFEASMWARHRGVHDEGQVKVAEGVKGRVG